MEFETIIRQIAQENGTTPEAVKEEMQTAINAAKDTPGFRQLFGNAVPTVEEFVLTTAALATVRNRH